MTATKIVKSSMNMVGRAAWMSAQPQDLSQSQGCWQSQGMLVICWSVLRLSPPASSIAISSTPPLLLDLAFLGAASVIVAWRQLHHLPPTLLFLPTPSHRTPSLPNCQISAQYLLQSSCHCTVKVHRISRCGRSVEKCKK